MTRSLSFSSWGNGELAPINRGHIDMTQYYASAESLDNMIVRPYAVPVRRAGTKYAGSVKYPAKDTRLIEFVFSVDESYIIEMGDLYLRFWDNTATQITFDLSTVVAWADATDYVIGDVVSSTSSDAWANGVYAVGDYVTNGGNLYICTTITVGDAGVEQPGVGSDWETYWTLIGDEDRFFLCIAGHTSVTADNKPRFGTKWSDFWYDMAAAAGETSATWILEVETPYTEAQIWDVDYAQKDDVIKMTHHLHDIAELRRYASDKWAFVQGIIEGPPWEDLNDDKDKTVKVGTAAVGTGRTFTAPDDDVFLASDVGRYFRVGELNVDGEQGYVLVTAVASPTAATCDVIVALINNNKTTKWARNAFYENNYPAHVTYYEDRLVLASSPVGPQKIWLSKTNIYNDFNLTDEDSGGFDMVLNTEQANDIKWLSAGETLASGTFGAEFTSRSPSDGALNNTNKNARRQSGWGSEFVRPKKIGNRLYFVQRTGRKLREYFYWRDNDNYAAQDMTKYSDHITLSGIVDMDYQRNQDSLLWCVLENGRMAILSRHPDEEVQAWTPWVSSDSETQSEVKSVRFIPNPDEESDRGFIIVNRFFLTDQVATIKKYIEYFDNHVVEDNTRQDDLYYVDSGVFVNQYELTKDISITISAGTSPITITADSAFFTSEMNGHNLRTITENGNTITTFEDITYVDSTHITIPIDVPFETTALGGLWGVSINTFTGLDHLNEQECDMFCDGVYKGTDTVDESGTVYPEIEFYKGSAGLPFTSMIQTNPLNAQTPTGMAKGHIRCINGLSVELYRSLEMEYSSVGGDDDADWFPVGVPEGTDATVLFTGTVPNLTYDGGKNYEGYIYLRQTKPYSMNVLGIYPELKIN